MFVLYDISVLTHFAMIPSSLLFSLFYFAGSQKFPTTLFSLFLFTASKRDGEIVVFYFLYTVYFVKTEQTWRLISASLKIVRHVSKYEFGQLLSTAVC